MSAVLNITDVSKKFGVGAKSVQALDQVSLQAFSGETLVLLGPNGSGKTTLIKVMVSLTKPDTGFVEVSDSGYESGHAKTLINCLLGGGNYLYQKLTVEENIEYAAALQGVALEKIKVRMGELIDQFGLRDKAAARVSTLSTGMQKKVAVIACLITEPRVLILDEPTLGLDISACDELLATILKIQSMGVAVIFATHQLDIAEKIASRVAILYRGKLLKCASLDDLLINHSSDDMVLRLRTVPSSDFASDVISKGASKINDLEFLLPNSTSSLSKYLNGVAMTDLESVERRGVGLEAAFRSILATNDYV